MFRTTFRTTPVSRSSRRIPDRVLGLAVAVLALIMASTPANAGFFDFLFNPNAPAWNPFAPAPEQVQPRQRSGPVASKKKPHRVSVRALSLLGKTRPSGLPLTSRDLMDDDSLRGGDAVMTPSGIRIFTGPSGQHHRPENFASLAEIKGLSAREHSALGALDSKASGARPIEARSGLVTGRSAVEPLVAVGTLITDPKGRKVRYVGP